MSHTTRYGNTYSAAEWLEMQNQFKAEQDREDEIQAEFDSKMNGMLNFARRQCREFGFNDSQTEAVIQILATGDANVQFSSKKSEDFVNDLADRFNKAMNKLSS